MITIRNLSKQYGNKLVLDSINLDLEEGKVHGFVGKNGAGKSTLFRSVSSLEKFNGDISFNLKGNQKKIGFLMTNPVFISYLTAREYLQLLCMSRGISVNNFDDYNIFDLPLDHYAENYSTGMKKKLALLGLLLQQNEVYILDEPYNGVDYQSFVIIDELIDELRKKGKTILISSHIYSTLTEKCDFIHHLDNGKIVKTLFPDDFLTFEIEMKRAIIGEKIRTVFE